MAKRRHNPERREFRGRSYRKGGRRIRALRDKILADRRARPA